MLTANFKPKRTAAASRGFLATTSLSCFITGSGASLIRAEKNARSER